MAWSLRRKINLSLIWEETIFSYSWFLFMIVVLGLDLKVCPVKYRGSCAGFV
jgi:surface polysaccharide O-acyltransferase-like enzyme